MTQVLRWPQVGGVMEALVLLSTAPLSLFLCFSAPPNQFNQSLWSPCLIITSPWPPWWPIHQLGPSIIHWACHLTTKRVQVQIPWGRGAFWCEPGFFSRFSPGSPASSPSPKTWVWARVCLRVLALLVTPVQETRWTLLVPSSDI